MKWFRLWTDILDDHKIAQLNDYEYRVFIDLMALISEQDAINGRLTWDLTAINKRLRRRYDHIKRAVETFQKVELISIDSDGFITITNWDKRQFKSDDSYSRVKKYRETMAVRNVSETANETPSDSDSDSDSYYIHNSKKNYVPVSVETGLTKSQQRIEKLKTEKQTIKEKIKTEFETNRAFLKEKFPLLDLDFELALMMDWVDRSFSKAKKWASGDLNLAFQNWMRRAKPPAQNQNYQPVWEDQDARVKRVLGLAHKIGKIPE